MSYIRRHARVLAVALSCLGIGAAGSAIAAAGASPSSSAARARAARGALARAGWRREFVRTHAVHGELVVATRQGFKTIVLDRGFVDSVSGNALVIREGTRKATYRTLTLTIPAGARVIDNRQPATLSQLTPGEHVLVVQGPQRTLVVARTPVAGQ